ncbi:MAG: Dipeptidyl aminopeptidase/acylaminoacyl peptidase, partial [Modestobacter sp.]|nr:Dipeptidyl aminopeptidase/acylaminoacyl peptidase [Modestobacter sp.]
MSDSTAPSADHPEDFPSGDAASRPAPSSPFHRLADFVALPRLGGLALSPDGTRLVTAVSTLDAEGTKWLPALWEVDPAGRRAARRLTRGAEGESAPVFTPDGDLLFTAARPGGRDGGTNGGDPKPALWSLSPTGGEARLVLQRPSGISGVAVAADSGEIAVVAGTMPGAGDAEADERRRTRRKEAGVTAVLHESYPVRFWDHDLGPAVPHVYWVGRLPAETVPGTPAEEPEWRNLTPDAGPPSGAGDDITVSPDGRFVLRAQEVPDGPAGRRSRLVLTEAATGESRVLVDDPLADVGGGRFSPDGSQVVCVRESASSYSEPPDYTLLLVDTQTGDTRDLTPGFDRWPSAPQFDAAGSAVFFLADDDGRHALFRLDLDGGEPVRLTRDGAY